MHASVFAWFSFSVISLVLPLSVHDPRLSPGHLQPLGSGRPKNPVEAALHYPDPADFFSKYVDKKIPLVIRGGAKSFPAYSKWSIAYFKKTPELESMKVSVDRDKKELNNISDYRHMTFGTFLNRFQKEELYLVDGVKKPMQTDILLPSPLRCKETRQHLQDTAIWYSSGGTKSLFSMTHRDEINCVLKGTNEYLMLPYMKHREMFQRIKAEAQLREIDVDRVDFGKYPQLEDVEWISAHLSEGDCVYIPYKWANQVNSYGGKTKESLFISFSFNHMHDIRPKDCAIDPSQATLDKYQFSTLEIRDMQAEEAEHAHQHGNETGNGVENGDHYHDGQEQVVTSEERGLFYFKSFYGYLKQKQSKTLNFQQFVEILKKDTQLFEKLEAIGEYNFPDSFQKLTREIFDLLDNNRDSMLSKGDFTKISKSKRYEEILSDLEWRLHSLETYVEDFIESSHHGMSNEEFDANRKARELRKKLSIHDPMEL